MKHADGSCTQRINNALFDHLVGQSEQFCRSFKAETFRGLEIDHELKFGRLEKRQVSRLIAFQNPADINTGLAVLIGRARTVAHQSSGGRIFAATVHRWNLVSRGQGDELFTSIHKNSVVCHKEYTDTSLHHGRKSGVEIVLTASRQDQEVLSDAASCVQLALLYKNGAASPPAGVRPEDLLRRACDLGFAEACRALQSIAP